MSRRGYPQDTYRDDMAETQAGQHDCERGDWCSSRLVTFVDGERIVTPGQTPRAYCDRCQEYLAGCAADLPGYWLRLSLMTGDPLQATVPVHIPFGPQVIVREDIDSWLRYAAFTLGSWAGRVRGVPGLQLSAPKYPHDTAKGVRDNAEVLRKHVSVLLALQDSWMTRQVPMPPMPRDEDMGFPARDWLPDGSLVIPRDPAAPFPDDLAEEYAEFELIRVTIDSIQPWMESGAVEAGRELQWLHYRARSLLLETNPPPELLIAPCRQCTWRALRRAYPESDRDLYSRCDNCGDEMDWEDYNVNAKRWLAYHKAQTENLPVLGETPAA
jgi:hypothetical protein